MPISRSLSRAMTAAKQLVGSGRTLEANRELVAANAQLAAEVAVAYSAG